MPEPQVQQTPTIIWLMTSGGFAPLAVGLSLALVGIVFVIRPNRTGSIVVAFLSLLPATIGLLVVYLAASAYAEMAVAPSPPKPTEFAEVTGRALSASFCGLLGTMLALIVSVLGLCRRGS